MAKRTLYISDLDGTLLNSNSLVSDNTVSILNDLIDNKGILFSVATARTPATVIELLQEVHTNLPYIVMTGSAMWKEGLINRRYLRGDEARAIVELCDKHGISPFLYTYNEEGSIIEAFHRKEMTPYESVFVDQRVGTPFKKFTFTDVFPSEALEKVMLVFAAGDYERVVSLHEEAAVRTDCSMTCYRDIFDSSTGFLEAMGRNVSKATAVEQLAAEVGADRIVVFGDSPNDLSMRQVADMFVAPANASEQVLAVADAIADSNNNDCVARWIAADVAAGE